MTTATARLNRMDEYAITSSGQLAEIYEPPIGQAVVKQIDRLDEHCRALIGSSPFVTLASSSADGRCDVTPRGGAPGFCRVLEDGRLAIPDVKGNRRLDSLRNIVENPHAGLLFMVPGMRETLRVNGSAHLTQLPEVIELVSEPGKLAILAIVVSPDEVFLHCAKALIRSSLWNPSTWPDAGALPSAAQVFRDHIGGEETVAEVEARLEEGNRTRLY